MWLWFPVASAEPAGGFAETCAPLILEATLPKDGDVGVPPDVMPVLVHNNGCGAVPFPILIDDLASVQVEVTLEEPSSTAVRIVPDELLTVGAAYVVDVPQTGDMIRFTVGDGAPVPAPAEPTVEAEFGGACAELTTLSVDLTAALPDADPAQRGLVWLLATVDGVAAEPIGPVVYDGQPVIELSADLLGGRRLCVTVAFDALTGRAWETDEICGDEFVCPDTDDDDDESGCGCATGDGGAVGALAGLVLLARRRR